MLYFPEVGEWVARRVFSATGMTLPRSNPFTKPQASWEMITFTNKLSYQLECWNMVSSPVPQCQWDCLSEVYNMWACKLKIPCTEHEFPETASIFDHRRSFKWDILTILVLTLSVDNCPSYGKFNIWPIFFIWWRVCDSTAYCHQYIHEWYCWRGTSPS